MPFWLYQCESNDSRSLTFRRLRRVSIGGKSGPIAAHVTGECETGPGCGWRMTEARIIDGLGESYPEHAVLIDLKPNVRGNVSLYWLTDVWGFSYEEWTPVCLRLESLFIDAEEEDAEEFKREFEYRPEDGGEIIHEFLYLKGGVGEGTWNWGMAGSVNGALLFRDAWEYLVSQVRYE